MDSTTPTAAVRALHDGDLERRNLPGCWPPPVRPTGSRRGAFGRAPSPRTSLQVRIRRMGRAWSRAFREHASSPTRRRRDRGGDGTVRLRRRVPDRVRAISRASTDSVFHARACSTTRSYVPGHGRVMAPEARIPEPSFRDELVAERRTQPDRWEMSRSPYDYGTTAWPTNAFGHLGREIRRRAPTS